MSATLGVLTLVLLGFEAAPGEAAPQICYEFRVLQMTGVEWREGVYTSLQPVTRQGGATVWTTTDAVTGVLAKKADAVRSVPKITACSGAPAHVSTKVSRGVVTQLSRQADGPVNHATKVSYTPEPERIRDGLAATVAGRHLDQGVLVKLIVEDTRVDAVHAVALTEFQEPKGADENKRARWESVQATLEVPEVAYCELAGEWLIPKNGVLLASLGAHCVADANGKAVVRERLLVVKATALAEPVAVGVAPLRERLGLPAPGASFDVQLSVNGASRPRHEGGGVEKPAMPAPAAPSRTLPQGLNAEGEPVPLPPLPPEAPAPTARPDSAEPVATPQTKHPAGGKSTGSDAPAAPATGDAPAVPSPGADPAPAEPDVRKTAFPGSAATAPPAPAVARQTNGPKSPSPATGAGDSACCQASPGRATSTPDPLPEAAIPLAGRSATCPQEELSRKVAELIRAVERLRVAGDGREQPAGAAAVPPCPGSACDEGDEPASGSRPGQAYELRWPLSGIDLEVRVVPRRGPEPSARATWRPSGQPEASRK
jgi:hypothetical protein